MSATPRRRLDRPTPPTSVISGRKMKKLYPWSPRQSSLCRDGPPRKLSRGSTHRAARSSPAQGSCASARAASPRNRNRRARAGGRRHCRRPSRSGSRGVANSRGEGVLRCGAIAYDLPLRPVEPRFEARESPPVRRLIPAPRRRPPNQVSRRTPRSPRRRPHRYGGRDRRGSNGVPWISMCCAICSPPPEVLSSDINRPGLPLRLGAPPPDPGLKPSSSLRVVTGTSRQQLGRLLSRRAGIDAEQPAVTVAVRERADRVDEPAFLAHFLEEPRGHAAAENGRQHGGGGRPGSPSGRPGNPSTR